METLPYNKPYLLDTNAFLEAKTRYYRFAFCPAYWDWLIRKNQDGIVFSLDKVKDEIHDKVPPFSTWVEKMDAQEFFLSSDGVQHHEFCATLNNWVNEHTQYEKVAKDRMLQGADLPLIVYAKMHRYTLVTQEVRAPDSKTEIKIPDVCDEFGINCINTFDMLEKEQAQFIILK